MIEQLMIGFVHAVVHTLWQGALAASLAWLFARLWRRRPAQQHVVWCGALMLLAVCLPLNLAFLAPPVVAGAAAEDGASGSAAEVVRAGGSALGTPPGEEMRPGLVGALGARGGERHAREFLSGSQLGGIRAARWVVGVYVLGLAAMGFRLAVAWRGGRRWRERAWPVREREWLRSLDRALARMAAVTRPALRWSEDVATPVLIGLGKPVILLPVAIATRLTPAQAEALLAHELAHLLRRDQWVLAIQRLVETALFYHPAVWWMSGQLSRCREEACDDLVLARGTAATDYAESLVLCSEVRSWGAGLSDPGWRLAATGGRGSLLRQRVRRVLGIDDPVWPVRDGWWLAAMLGAVAVAGAVVAGAVPGGPGAGADDRAVLAEPPTAGGGVPHGEGHQSLIVAEIVIAEVPAAFAADGKSMVKEELERTDHVTVLSAPKLVLEPGRQGTVEIGSLDHGDPPREKLRVGLTARGLSADDGPAMASYHLVATSTRPGKGGAVRSQTIELESRAAWRVWVPFEMGALDAQRKLVGALRLTGLERKAAGSGGQLFDLDRERRVWWNGRAFGLGELKEALPDAGEGPVTIGADAATPYVDVTELLEILIPVFGTKISVEIRDGGASAAGESADGAGPAEDAELAGRRKALEVLLDQRRELLLKFTAESAAVRSLDQQIDVVRRQIRDAETAVTVRAEAAAPGEGSAAGSSRTRDLQLLRQMRLLAAETELAEKEDQLQALLASGLGSKHPRVRELQQRVGASRARLDDLAELGALDRAGESDIGPVRDENAERLILRGVVEMELAELEDDLQALLASGLGSKHPKVRGLAARVEAMRTRLGAWGGDPADDGAGGGALPVLAD